MLAHLFLVAAFYVLAATASQPGPVVDLTYAVYAGVFDSASGLNIWKGIRYAAPPLGSLRWQAPQAPEVNRTLVPLVADTPGPACPQVLSAKPGASAVFIPGNEDCLFLNVYSPAAASNGSAGVIGYYPVLVVIHGGGYGLGDASQDMADFINTNGNSMVVVAIQYRVWRLGSRA